MASTMLVPIEASVLERVIDPVGPADEIDRLADKAVATLGYSGLKAAVNEKIHRPNDSLELLAILREHGIKLFHPEEVERYKKEKAARASSHVRLGRAVSAILMASLVIFFFGLVTAVIYQPVWAGPVVFLSMFVMTGSTLILAFSTITTATWERHPLNNGYTGSIPRDVIELAIGLKQSAPKVEFDVDVLRVEKRILDPFLVVRLGEAEFAIAVWDEPKFNSPLVD